MRRLSVHSVVSGLTLVLLMSLTSFAKAGMVLTSDGLAAGFKLSTFASGFPSTDPNFGYGPIGIAFPTSGGVLVTDNPTGQIVQFLKDTDGQSYPGNSTVGGFSGPDGLTVDNGLIYLATQGGSRIWQLNNDGSRNHLVTSLAAATGITVNPTNNHLFVSATNSTGHIYDIDPSNGNTTDYSATHKNAGIVADGMTFSPDGKTLYVALYGRGLASYDVATGIENFFVSIPGSDGTALGTGTLAGNIYDNTNFGQLIQINLKTLQQTVIASGGSRGDFVEVDPNNSTLLLTQSDSVLRLTAPPGGGFGSPVPEPTSLTLAGLGALGLLGYGRRRERKMG